MTTPPPIPATPAATAKTLPVRRLNVRRTELAHDPGWYDTTYASEHCGTDPDPDSDVYTLLPPHLAEQWRELRKVRHEAEIAMLQSHKRDADANIVFVPHLFMAWSKAATNLVLFETQHGIGGGT
jgi:hypothetical protein